MPDIYALAWFHLKRRIAKTRRQSISKDDLVVWQLEALEQAIDIFRSRCSQLHHGKQETPQTPQV